jgi:hypothetical protein
MIEKLIQLIHEYQNRVREAVELFERYKGLKRPQHPLEWQLSGISRKGYLDPRELQRMIDPAILEHCEQEAPT